MPVNMNAYVWTFGNQVLFSLTQSITYEL